METMFGSKNLKVRVTFITEVLGSAPNDDEIYATYVAGNAPDAPSKTEEIETMGVDGFMDRAMTVFRRDEDGTPLLWDYQVKGFFKDACGSLKKVEGTRSSKVKAYKKEIDQLVFVYPRKIRLDMHGGELTKIERSLRASTAQGERIALASSEAAPAGTTFECEIVCLTDSSYKNVKEWLDYGKLRGMGQWRNGSFGRFVWEEIKDQ